MSTYIEDIISSLKQYRFSLVLIFIQFILFGIIFLIVGKFPVYNVSITYLLLFWSVFIIFIPSYSIFIVIGYIFSGKNRPILSLINYYWSKLSDGIFVTHFVMAPIVFMLTVIIFSSIKSSIPSIVPFWADPYFIEYDKFLFFGNLPHDIFKILFENDNVIIALNFVYNAQLLTIVWFIFFIALTSNNKLRFHILHASIFAFFIAGNWMAVIFSSAGPAFYGYFFDGNMTYMPLMENLEAINARTGQVWALTAQRILLESYSHPESPISGISAMPSLHVLQAFFIAFITMRVGKITAVAGYSFAFIILVGSVVLGWHYAVDGIIGFFAAIVFWKISHPITLRAIERKDSA